MLIDLTLWTVLKAKIASSSLACVGNIVSVCNLGRFWHWCQSQFPYMHVFLLRFFLWVTDWNLRTWFIFFIYSTRNWIDTRDILHVGYPTDLRSSDDSNFPFSLLGFFKRNDLEVTHLTLYPRVICCLLKDLGSLLWMLYSLTSLAIQETENLQAFMDF